MKSCEQESRALLHHGLTPPFVRSAGIRELSAAFCGSLRDLYLSTKGQRGQLRVLKGAWKLLAEVFPSPGHREHGQPWLTNLTVAPGPPPVTVTSHPPAQGTDPALA